LTKALQPFDNNVDPFLPGDVFPTPFSSLSFSLQGMANSIRIIENLEPSLTFWAESAFVDRVILYSIQLNRPLVDRSDSKPATAGALETDTG
jgi:hypothetical protein